MNIKKDLSEKICFRRWMLIFSVFSVIMISLVVFMTIRNIPSDRVVALVNGEPITELEFKLQLAKNRAYVYDYFQRKYGVADNQEFWNTPYDGEIPIEVARKKTLNEALRIKIQQILAKQKGIVQDISYQGFLINLKKENTRRKEAVKQGRPVFGPVLYDESGYYSYLFENMVIRLKEVLAGSELQVTDGQVREYYEQVRDQKFRKEDSVRVQKLSIPYIAQGKKGPAREEVKAIMETIRNKSLAGGSLRACAAELVRSCQLKNSLQVSYSQQTMDSSTARFDSRTNPILRNVADQTKVGEVSEIFEENGAFNIIKPIIKKAGGYYDFSEYKAVISSDLVNIKYDELINHLARESKPEIMESVYRQLHF